MTEIDRKYQYKYVISAMRVEDMSLLVSTRKMFEKDSVNLFDFENVFKFAPHNDNLLHATNKMWNRSYTERSRPFRYYNAVLIYLSLMVDVEPDCCYDGHLHLVVGESGLRLRCDRCNKLYSLDRATIESEPTKIAGRKLLMQRFGVESEEQWPFAANVMLLEKKYMSNI